MYRLIQYSNYLLRLHHGRSPIFESLEKCVVVYMYRSEITFDPIAKLVEVRMSTSLEA